MTSNNVDLGSLSVEELRAQLEGIQSQVQSTRRERLALTGSTPNQEPIDEATIRAEQDRDAQVNPELTRERERLSEAVTHMRDLCSRADRKRWMLWRMETTGVDDIVRVNPQTKALVVAALDRERGTRERAREDLAPMGIEVPNIMAISEE